MIAQFPKSSSKAGLNHKLYEAPSTTWNLMAGGLYSFKVCMADPDSGEISITANHPDFTEFVLPVNPQGLQTAIQFAINVTPTNGGILEESNGVVFRQLSISGTFGVSARKVSTSETGPSSLTSQDLRITAPQNQIKVSAAGISPALVNTIGAAIATQAAGLSKPPQLISGIKASDLDELGHKKINDLLNYLVAYTETKKVGDTNAKRARLVFIDRKNGVNYGCTPITFDTTKDANDPHVTRYRIALKVWDIASGKGLQGTTAAGYAGSPSPSELTKAMNTLLAARATVGAAQGVLRGVVADFDNVVGAVNSATLLIKGLNNLTQSWADLDGPTGLVALKGNELKSALRQLVLTATSDPDLADSLGLTDRVVDATNPTAQPVSSAPSLTNFANQQLRDFSNPLRTPEQRLRLVTYLDQLTINAIALTPNEQAVISNAVTKASQLTIGDLDAMRATLESARDSFTDSLGLTDATVNATTGRVAGPKLRDPQPEDYLVLQRFSDMVSVVDTLTATRDLFGVRTQDPFLRAQDNANNPGIVVTSSTTGFPIPFPAGTTLEQLAAQYLGSPDRWIEIAVANGLQPPYIDETGFEILFNANGSSNTFLVADAVQLYVGQEVFVSSVVMPPSRRIVTALRKLASGSWLVQVDGDPDLVNYQVTRGATVRGYARGTVNSSKTIVIPTPGKTPGDSVPDTKVIPATANLTRQQKAMGVDLFLTPDFDIALNGSGDFKLATGLANVIQAVKLAISIEKGSLIRHPEKGLGLQIGTRQRSTDGIRASIENSILADDRFESIPSLSITFDGDVIRLNMTVKVAGGSDLIPLSFALQ